MGLDNGIVVRTKEQSQVLVGYRKQYLTRATNQRWLMMIVDINMNMILPIGENVMV